jgi:hypothetical protein
MVICSVQAQTGVTGRTWGQWDQEHRVVYLMGFYDGYRAHGLVFNQAEHDHPYREPFSIPPSCIVQYKTDRQEYYSRNLKLDFKAIRDLIDIFYTDPDNLDIPVSEAIRITALRDEGQHERADFLLRTERRKVLQGKP